MPSRRLLTVDVFTNTPFRGNPLAVVIDAEGLSTEAMQRFTDWTNLSECTFLLPPTHPDADYRVRIFCPGRELPFAGHPTLGSAHAWLATGGQPKADEVVQECGVGLVSIRRAERLAFAAPPLRRSGPLPEDEVSRLAAALGLSREHIVAHAHCDNGPPWMALLLDSAERVLAVNPDRSAVLGLEVGLIGPWRTRETPEAPAFEVRAFFTGNAVVHEDPVTGSLNAALAQWLTGEGLAPARYVAAQGTALGRAGRVHVERTPEGTIWIGGHTVTCVEGMVGL
jgi:PhzF family phenazine biosynthesis protein